MLIEGKVGPRKAADGAESPARLGGFGEAIVAQAGGKYLEAVLRGLVFTGGTPATGVAHGTSIGTTAAFTLANPAGSAVRLVVLRTTLAYISGTLGAGAVHYLANTNPAAAAVTGTAITAVNALIGSQLQAAGKPFTTATLPASPTILRPFASVAPLLATTAVQPYQVIEDVDGEFIVAPGCSISLHGTATAGSTPLVVYGMTWMELPI